MTPKVQFGLFISIFFVVWTFRATLLVQIDRTFQTAETRLAFATLVKVLLWALPAALFGIWVRRENPLRFLGISGFPDSRTWAKSLLAIAIFSGIVLGFELFAGHKKLSFGLFSAEGLLSKIAIFVVSPFVEEILFRGLVLKELSDNLKPILANIMASAFFVGSHLPYWIWNDNPPLEIASTSIGIFVFSLFAGWLYLMSKSIWPPTVAHIANNVLSAFLGMR